MICEEACRILGADRSLVIRRIDDSNQREILYANNMPVEYLEKLAASRAETMMAVVFRNQKLKVFSDVGRDSNIFDPEDIRKIGLRTLCAIPLVVGGESYAALLLHHLKERKYSSGDLQIAEAFGDLASMAIEKTLLLAENEDRAARMEIVGRIAKITGSSLEPDEIFRAIAREIRHSVSCDRCVVGSVDPETEVIRQFVEDADTPMGPPASNEDRKGGIITRFVYETRRPVNVPDIPGSQWRESRYVKAGYRSALVIPTIQEGRCVAHMSLQSRQANAFSKEHEDLLNSIASHLSPAIRNAGLYQAAEDRASRLAVLN